MEKLGWRGWRGKRRSPGNEYTYTLARERVSGEWEDMNEGDARMVTTGRSGEGGVSEWRVMVGGALAHAEESS